MGDSSPAHFETDTADSGDPDYRPNKADVLSSDSEPEVPRGKLDEFKLIEMIKNRPAIYDPNHPKHNTRNYVDGYWCEIAEELGVQVHEVRNKWHVLRCSFNRVLKQTETSKRQSGKPWPYFDAMYFIKDFMRGRVKRTFENGDASSSFISEPSVEAHQIVLDSATDTNGVAFAPSKQHLLIYEDGSTQLVPAAKRVKTEPNHHPSPQQHHQPPTRASGDVNEMFLMSLLPDIAKLNPAKVRQFKSFIFSKLMTMLDEQETEAAAARALNEALPTAYMLEARTLES